MFGYVTPRMEDLTQDERERYHAAYCGVCRALGARCGQRCRVSLTYDMTFLALLLDSLYESDERVGCRRCVPHPARPHVFIGSDCVDYAADMSVALVYHKCLDDWNDDRSAWARAYAMLLEKPYRAVRERHPRTCAAIEEGLADIARLERAAAKAASAAADGPSDAAAPPPPDAAANRFGALLGEVFAYRDDFWADGLRALGARLGKLVYVMDAAVDWDDDRASGSYNPLVALGAQPQDIREDLEVLAADAAAAFERLPLERDVRVLRSVMYAGVWQKYYAKEAKRAQKGQGMKADEEARRD